MSGGNNYIRNIYHWDQILTRVTERRDQSSRDKVKLRIKTITWIIQEEKKNHQFCLNRCLNYLNNISQPLFGLVVKTWQ